MIASTLALLPFALLAAATTQCDTGIIQCCNSTSSFTDAQPYMHMVSSADVAAAVDAVVGLDCSSINVVGTSDGCFAHQEPLCCQNSKYEGVSLGCVPINIQI